MNEAYSRRDYGGLACSIGVPVLVRGEAVAALLKGDFETGHRLRVEH